MATSMGHDLAAIAGVQQQATADAGAAKGPPGSGSQGLVPYTAVSEQIPPPQPPLLDRGPGGTADTSEESAEGE